MTTRTALRVGLSTCPNDTFACHAILERKIDLCGLDLDIDFRSVQELNEKLAKGELDFSKASSHAALHVSEQYGVLRAGASFGIGSGPLLLAMSEGSVPTSDSRVLCPGPWTTGTLLFRCLYPHVRRIEHRPFWEIIPALTAGEADFGVVIHEGRFTYHKEGLSLVSDLGSLWPDAVHGQALLPLGLVLGRLDLGTEVHQTFRRVFRSSIAYALAHRLETLPTMQRFAQELDAAVIWSYVDLYVNRYTLDLDTTGEEALAALEQRARAAGVVDAAAPPLRCIG